VKKRPGRAILKVALITLLVLGILYAGSGLALFAALADVRGSCGQHAVNRPDRILFDDHWPPIDLSRYAMPDYETVRFPSRQPGINIAGWWVPGEPGAPAVILVHGIGGCKNAIDVLVPAGMLWRNGFSVLLIDVRNVGDSDSDGGWTSAGNKEYLDVLGAWDWVRNEKGYLPERIGLLGVSLGGATALYAFSEEPRIAALFLESTFAHLTEAFTDNLRERGLPLFLANPATVMGNLVTHGTLFAHDPLSAIRMARGRPVYIVHSRADQRINIREGEQLAAAARAAGVDVTTWFPDKSKHLQTPALYPDEFERRLVGFFRDALGFQE
jgi:pimeloyl-ACP methyl ester carboxylesterase